MIYGIDWTLNEEWWVLTRQLGLDFPQQTYLIWLWLNTALQISYNRIPSGGMSQTGMIANIGAEGAANSFTIMQLEFPLLVMAQAFSKVYSQQYNLTQTQQQNCVNFYNKTLGIDEKA